MPVVRATPTGISAIVDADGRILKSLPAGSMGMMALPMPAALPATLFAHFGNWAVAADSASSLRGGICR